MSDEIILLVLSAGENLTVVCLGAFAMKLNAAMGCCCWSIFNVGLYRDRVKVHQGSLFVRTCQDSFAREPHRHIGPRGQTTPPPAQFHQAIQILFRYIPSNFKNRCFISLHIQPPSCVITSDCCPSPYLSTAVLAEDQMEVNLYDEVPRGRKQGSKQAAPMKCEFTSKSHQAYTSPP